MNPVRTDILHMICPPSSLILGGSEKKNEDILLIPAVLLNHRVTLWYSCGNWHPQN